MERAAPEGSTPWVLTLRSEGRLVGLAPLLVHETAGSRVVRLFGEGLPTGLDVLMDPELASHGVALLFQWLARNRGHWDVCVLDQLREGPALLRTPLHPRVVRAPGAPSPAPRVRQADHCG